MEHKRRIAIIGGGISGLGAAWLLREQADVTLFEADGRFGGHSHTVRVMEKNREIPIDTGFMVFNRPNYPLLGAFFDHLGVSTYPTRMSFSVSLDGGAVEYAGGGITDLFAQRQNLVRPAFWRMIRDILRFNRLAHHLLSGREEGEPAGTLGALLDRHGFSEYFRQWYLYPMAAAIWSCPRDQMGEFPASSFLRFFSNHGLVQLSDRPRWETVVGGASTYVERLTRDLGASAICARPVTLVRREANGASVVTRDGETRVFDDVVFACHADQAVRILRNPTAAEQNVLSAVRYQKNQVFLHTDETLMPTRRSLWSSWNYIGRDVAQEYAAVSVTYWMNSLQRLDSRQNYFVSLNPPTAPRDNAVIAEMSYDHPVFDTPALEAQTRLTSIQGKDRLWFCGAWTGYGFHEDGIRSGYTVARAMGARIPWQQQAIASRKLVAPSNLVAQPA